MTRSILLLATFVIAATLVNAQAPEPLGKPVSDAPIEQVTIHPLFKVH
jgi:hypothetical protein